MEETEPEVDTTISDFEPSMGASDIASPRSPTSRRGEAPPRRFRHTATIVISAGSVVLFVLLSCLNGSPDAPVHLATGVGFSGPHRWYFTVMVVIAALTCGVASWLPPFQEPTVDWEQEKRSRKLRELIEEEIIFETHPDTGEVNRREKTLVEMGLEGALRSAEAELAAERALNGQRPPQADRDTINWSKLHVAIAATLNTSKPEDRPTIGAFVQRLYGALNAQNEREHQA